MLCHRIPDCSQTTASLGKLNHFKIVLFFRKTLNLSANGKTHGRCHSNHKNVLSCTSLKKTQTCHSEVPHERQGLGECYSSHIQVLLILDPRGFPFISKSPVMIQYPISGHIKWYGTAKIGNYL